MHERLRRAARSAKGFLPEDDGLALYAAGVEAGSLGPLLEVGGYCGRSAIYLGAAAARAGTVLFSIDHHRGSEEHQPGQQYYDAGLVDNSGLVDTLPAFRSTVAAAGLEPYVIAVVGRSETVGRHWTTPLGLVFIDGGHSRDAAWNDFRIWPRLLIAGGLLAIHDVFPDPASGGRPPFEIYSAARARGEYQEVAEVGSLRILRRVREPEQGSD